MRNLFTISKFAGNPILVPQNDDGYSQDSAAVRDATFIKTGSTYNLIYSGYRTIGFSAEDWALTMVATMAGPTSTPVRKGIILPYQPEGLSPVGWSETFLAYDGTTWHAWTTANPDTPAGLLNNETCIPHFTCVASGASVPLTGWVIDTPTALVGKTTGWTSTTTGDIAGVASPKIVPGVAGGFVMFITNWGSAASKHQVGFATATSLDGPWTLNDTPLFGDPNGYQAEQITPFQYKGRHYLICNRLGFAGLTDDLGIDLWGSENQLGPYELIKTDLITRDDGEWDEQDGGVVGLVDYQFESGHIYGIYDANDNGSPQIERSIGAFTLGLRTPLSPDASTCDIDSGSYHFDQLPTITLTPGETADDPPITLQYRWNSGSWNYADPNASVEITMQDGILEWFGVDASDVAENSQTRTYNVYKPPLTKLDDGEQAGQRKQSNGSAAGTIKRNVNGSWQ